LASFTTLCALFKPLHFLQNAYKQLERKLQIAEYDNRLLRNENFILQSNTNKGEKDEVRTMQRIFQYNEAKQYSELANIFGPDAQEGVSVINPDTGQVYTDMMHIKKVNSQCKADGIFKMLKTSVVYSCSIKSNACSKHALLNHTPRSAKVFGPTGFLHTHLNHLDVVMKEYIDKRNAGIFTEDVSMNRLESLQTPMVRESVVIMMMYFMFLGTGKGDSKKEANSILFYEKDGSVTFVPSLSDEQKKMHVSSILDDCVLSLREKGMPKKIADINHPWTYHDTKQDGKVVHKGCLHIRGPSSK